MYKRICSQITNARTTLLYYKRMKMLATNVFIFKKLNEYIDINEVNRILYEKGSIAWFYEDVLESVVALPYTVVDEGKTLYGKPAKIRVFSNYNNYYRELNQNEFVIMYDNTSKESIAIDTYMAAERIALTKRTIDINVYQQRTPRYWKASENNVTTIRGLVKNFDALADNVIPTDSLDLDEVSCVLAPAPYVADKLDIRLQNEWNEFLQLIGIDNLSISKKERVIQDEVNSMLGGTIALRYSRFSPREEAIKLINKKWNQKIEVKYYDSEPSSVEKEEGDNNDDTNMVSNDDGEI